MIETSLPLTRRALLGSAGSAAALSALPTAIQASAQHDFGELLAQLADDALQLWPDQATSLGVDTGKNAGLRSKLSDETPAYYEAWEQLARSMKTRLIRQGRAHLSPQEQVQYDTVMFAIERGLAGAQFGLDSARSGFDGGANPYVINHQECAVLNVPEFLNSQHPVNTREDAEAYLARVHAFAGLIRQETDRLKHDAAHGVLAPSFIASNALGQLRGYRAIAAAEQGLVTSLAGRAKAKGIEGDWAARATKLIESEVYPALDAQIVAFAKATAHSSDVAGVGKRLKNGEAYYHWALGMGTTTRQTPAEVHAIGLAQNRELLGQMDVLLKAQGMTKGSVGARLIALNKDPSQMYPDTDAGRADILAYLNERIAFLRTLLPRISHMPLKADLTIKRVPPDIQDGAPLGYMNFASLDGSRPAIYYINLKSTDVWPKYQLPTLTSHEGLPGHAWQGAYLAEHHAEIPLMSSLMQFNAFVEGWALYAEQIANEGGYYEHDPFGRIGYLQAQQFRACRLVVDTGIHAMGWSREQSIAFLTEQTGRPKAAMTSETDRYCAWPGQACAYKTGHNEIIRLRKQAQAALGSKFDLAAFDDVVVQTGG
ncbi:MAG: DUF885 domain-containing protein, partial [Alphaproteobacteria bacterium]|nr:DUF885 domain-containing protein [Alphaproteobacteria bacterium]